MSKDRKDRQPRTDITRCMACHSCEVACAVAHSASKDLIEAMSEDPRPLARIRVVTAGDMHVPLGCRHCEDAPCIAICPANALEKSAPDRPVMLDEDKCVGCGYCVAACPLGVMMLSRDGKIALKCDLCIERLDEGLEPACVSACPTLALHFESVEAWIAERQEMSTAGANAQDACGEKDTSQTEWIIEGDSVRCEKCGEQNFPKRMIRRLEKECPEVLTAVRLCPQCRTVLAAQRWSEALRHGVKAGAQ